VTIFAKEENLKLIKLHHIKWLQIATPVLSRNCCDEVAHDIQWSLMRRVNILLKSLLLPGNTLMLQKDDQEEILVNSFYLSYL
jgi:hypothetical protein